MSSHLQGRSSLLLLVLLLSPPSDDRWSHRQLGTPFSQHPSSPSSSLFFRAKPSFSLSLFLLLLPCRFAQKMPSASLSSSSCAGVKARILFLLESPFSPMERRRGEEKALTGRRERERAASSSSSSNSENHPTTTTLLLLHSLAPRDLEREGTWEGNRD